MRRLNEFLMRRRVVGDVIVALVVLVFYLLEFDAHNLSQARTVILLVGFVFPLCLRRTHTLVAATLALIPHALQVLWTDSVMLGNVTVPILLHAVSVHAPARWAKAWLGIGWVGAAGAAVDWSPREPAHQQAEVSAIVFGACGAVVTAAWVMGRLSRERALALGQERELVAEQERARIARDMHDVVAHSLSVIVVQADGGQYVATHQGDPDSRLAGAAQALETIGETARHALAETRRLVGVLQSDDGSRQPQAALDQVPVLVRRLTEAGFPALLEVEGDPAAYAELGPGAEMAAYRVVQEALTNVMKHAGPGSQATVRLVHRPRELFVEIVDDGTGPGQGDGHGHGVIGMQERVSAFGGWLETGPREGGGYAVRASIPRRGEGER